MIPGRVERGKGTHSQPEIDPLRQLVRLKAQQRKRDQTEQSIKPVLERSSESRDYW
jgi:hypothetical protein